MKALHPIEIIGGGLAGLSLGIALRRHGLPVTLHEAGAYPRHRVCGEFVAGLSEETIEKLGIGPAFDGAGGHRSVSWFLRERPLGRQTLPAPARAVSRFALDARLAELFLATGGALYTGARRELPSERAGWVDTTGRRRESASTWIGLKIHARNLPVADDLELHLGDGAYVGLTVVEDGWVNVCGLFRRRHGLRVERDAALHAYLQTCGLHSLAGRLAAAHIRPGSRSAVAGFAFDRSVAIDEHHDGVRLGDACAMIPPFTGDGMAMAFTSAARALDPLVAWSRGEHPWQDAVRCIQEKLQEAFHSRLNVAALAHPFLLNRPLQRSVGMAMRSGLLPFASLYRWLH